RTRRCSVSRWRTSPRDGLTAPAASPPSTSFLFSDLRAAPGTRIVIQRSVELDTVAFGREVGTAASLAEDPNGRALPRDVGVLRLTPGGCDGITDGCLRRQYDGPEVLPRRVGIGNQAVFVRAAHGCG